MLRRHLLTAALMLLAATAAAPAAPVGKCDNVELTAVRFEPLAEGEGRVAVTVRNLTTQPQTFVVHAQTRTAPRGAGWGTQFTMSLAPAEEKTQRFGYAFLAAPESDGFVRLRGYHPPSAEQVDFDRFFVEFSRSVAEIGARAARPEALPPASPEAQAAVLAQCERIQTALRDGAYEQAWPLLTRVCREAGFQDKLEGDLGFRAFLDNPASPSAARWTKAELLRFQSGGVVRDADLALVRGRVDDAIWTLEFAQEDGAWRLDRIGGRPPLPFDRDARFAALLPQLEKHATEHVDIYVFPGSTAARDLTRIAEERERGYQAICGFLGVTDHPRLRLIFFEDPETKTAWALHRGMGLAYGATMVETYTPKAALDPFHETAHLLSHPLGDPPAFLSEGFAVYVSEFLGAPALKELSGGDLSVYARVRELKSHGQWIPLATLLTFAEIGSDQSRPSVAYPEAGAFVKYLVDTYGKEKLRAAYAELRTSEDPAVHQQNAAALERITGQSVADLERGWLAAMGIAGASAPAARPPTNVQPLISPTEPLPTSYTITARLDAERNLLTGTETVHVVNRSRLTLPTLAFEAPADGSESLQFRIGGQTVPASVTPLVSEGDFGTRATMGRSVLALLPLPRPLAPGRSLDVEVSFRTSPGEISRECGGWYLVGWHPKLRWGYSTQDDYAVRLDVPAGWNVAASGLLGQDGVWRSKGVGSFGVVAAPDFAVMEAKAGVTLIRALYRPAGQQAAEVLLQTAVDVVNYGRKEFGFYPQPYLSLVPGSSQSLGGFNVATGLSAFHAMENFAAQPLGSWRWITAHEIGHHYSGECTMDDDLPAWLWIGLGFYFDRSYTRAREGASGHRSYLDRYLDALRRGYDTTLSRPTDQLKQIAYNFNGIAIHGKGYTVISALESVLGPEQFARVYRKCLHTYRGKRLGAREFERFCEAETGQDLSWFFGQWVRSNRVLAYRVAATESTPRGARSLTRVTVDRTGTLSMPIPVEARFADGSSQRAVTDRLAQTCDLTFDSAAPLKEAVLDPDRVLPLLEAVPQVSPVFQQAQALPWLGAGAKAKEVYAQALKDNVTDSDVWLRLAMTLYDGAYYPEALDAFARLSAAPGPDFLRQIGVIWQGVVLDVMGRREEALRFYQQAKDAGFAGPITHSQYHMTVDAPWLEDRLKTPFVRK